MDWIKHRQMKVNLRFYTRGIGVLSRVTLLWHSHCYHTFITTEKELEGLKMVVGDIITCCTVEEVIRKAFELKDQGIITEFINNYSLRVVCIDWCSIQGTLKGAFLVEINKDCTLEKKVILYRMFCIMVFIYNVMQKDIEI